MFKKIYIILFFLILIQPEVFGRDNKVIYSRANISNYFLGIISAKKYEIKETHKYLKKVEMLKKHHSRYNIEFLSNLILLEKFDKALAFSKSIWKKDELFFEADLLLGLNYFKNKDYQNSEKYFLRLNKISITNLYFDDFVGNVLIAWSKAAQGKKKKSFDILEKVPKPFHNLKIIQKGFLKCYFDMENTQTFFEKIIQNEEYNFS